MVFADNMENIYQRPAELLQRLIQFDTTNPPGNETACIAYIDTLLKKAGFETTRLAKDPNRPNLITHLKGQGQAPPLLLYGHVDVVTTNGQKWTYPPFEGKLVDNFICAPGRKTSSQPETLCSPSCVTRKPAATMGQNIWSRTTPINFQKSAMPWVNSEASPCISDPKGSIRFKLPKSKFAG